MNSCECELEPQADAVQAKRRGDFLLPLVSPDGRTPPPPPPPPPPPGGNGPGLSPGLSTAPPGVAASDAAVQLLLRRSADPRLRPGLLVDLTLKNFVNAKANPQVARLLTWAEIWDGAEHIYDLKPANVVLDGVTGKLERSLNVGSADASFRAQIGDLDYTEQDVDFGGLPSMANAASYRLISYNAANTASITLASFITASEGFFSILVKMSNADGDEAIAARNLPGIIGNGSGWISLSYAGASQVVKAAGYSGGWKETPGALARDTAKLVTWVKTATHVELWINATKVSEIACGNLFGTNGVVYIGYSYGGESGKGKFGPMAAGKTVPADLATRLQRACATAGIS